MLSLDAKPQPIATTEVGAVDFIQTPFVAETSAPIVR